MTILLKCDNEQEMNELGKLRGYSLEGEGWFDEFYRYTFVGTLNKNSKVPTPTYENEQMSKVMNTLFKKEDK